MSNDKKIKCLPNNILGQYIGYFRNVIFLENPF